MVERKIAIRHRDQDPAIRDLARVGIEPARVGEGLIRIPNQAIGFKRKIEGIVNGFGTSSPATRVDACGNRPMQSGDREKCLRQAQERRSPCAMTQLTHGSGWQCDVVRRNSIYLPLILCTTEVGNA